LLRLYQKGGVIFVAFDDEHSLSVNRAPWPKLFWNPNEKAGIQAVVLKHPASSEVVVVLPWVPATTSERLRGDK